MSIVLADYVNASNLAFDPESGSVEAALSDAHVHGFIQRRNLGLFKNRKHSLVAVFLRGDELVLWLDRNEYRLLQPNLTARVEEVVPLVARRFTLREAGTTLFEARYWFFQRNAWPDDGDIFSLVTRIAESPDHGRGFLHVWRARSEGRDMASPEFLKELQSHVYAQRGTAR